MALNFWNILFFVYFYADFFQSYIFKLLFSKFQFSNFFSKNKCFWEAWKKYFEGFNPLTISAWIASSTIPGFPEKVRHNHARGAITGWKNSIFCLKINYFRWEKTNEGIPNLDTGVMEARGRGEFLHSKKLVILIESSYWIELIFFWNVVLHGRTRCCIENLCNQPYKLL